MISRRRFCHSTGNALLGSGLALGSASFAEACTRVLWNTNSRAVIVGRTMDWPESTEPVLTVFPAGMARDGGRAGPDVIVADNPARWTSKYGSLVTTILGLGTGDGLNERGLAGHMLYLNATDYGVRRPSVPGLHAGLWLQYALDQAASVTEALALLGAVQIVNVESHGHQANVHLALEDASGDSAIIEYIAGKQVVHHGRDYRVMTNDPPYDQQLLLLKQIQASSDFAHPSSNTPLPGNVSPPDRFQRASYYEAVLPEPADERTAIAAMFAIMANVSVPFGAPYKGFGVYNTEYRSVTDLTARCYYFQLTTVPSVIWAELPKFNLSPGAPVLLLNPDDVSLAGNVTAKFQPGKAPF